MALDRKSASKVLGRIAALLEVHGSNPHRVRAMTNAARAVSRFEGNLDDALESGELESVRGIGKSTLQILGALAEGEEPVALTDLTDRTPDGLEEILGLPGIGPKRVRQLWQKLDVTNLGELEYACRENRLIDLEGFGTKTQEKVLEAIGFARQNLDRYLLSTATLEGYRIRSLVAAVGEVSGVEVVGQVRRGCETVSEIKLVVAADRSDAVRETLGEVLVDVTRMDGTWIRGRSDASLPVSVRIVPEREFAAAIFVETGSQDHIAEIDRRLLACGVERSGLTLFRGGSAIAWEDETSAYGLIGHESIPPELREGAGEIEHAVPGGRQELVSATDLLGALHNHTTYSDGVGSLEEMAQMAASLGWRYIGIADHSAVAVYANGLDSDRLRQQMAEIDRLNAKQSKVRVLKGLEADILTDGTLDVPEECVSDLDYVVASVHSVFSLTQADQTERILRAVRHPACSVLGHPTGRLLLARPGYAVDLDAVLRECAKNGVAAEINASPYRLDLDWRWARRALELGIKLVINPDAHSPEGLHDVRWGLAVARKAGAVASDLLNTVENAGFGGGDR